MANKNTHATPADKSSQLRDYVLLAMFVAIVFLLGMTPIGLIQLPFIKATTMHIPVIIGSILLGPKKGAFLGLCFGIVSIVNNSIAPAALSFAFSPLVPVPGMERGSMWALVICFVPRMLVGVVPWVVYKLIRSFCKQENAAVRGVQLVVAGFLGSMTNTLLVMGLIGTVFNSAFAQLRGIEPSAVAAVVMGIVVSSGIPEAIVAAALTPAVTIPLQKFRRQDPYKGDGKIPAKAAEPVPAVKGTDA